MTGNSTNSVLEEDFSVKWDEFSRVLMDRQIRLPEHEKLNESIKTVFSLSDFVARSCIRHPSILMDLIQTDDLFTSYKTDGYEKRLGFFLSGTTDDADLGYRLRMFRHREMVRIAWRDLAGWANLDETLFHLTAFAESCIDQTADFLYSRQCRISGVPLNREGKSQKLVVLGMGKLGSRELNFSSDIDLIFAYPENGETDANTGENGKSISNEAFFLALARRLINLLSASSAEGNLFRVDMRLRPYGENGPLVLSFDAMEDYYQSQGREWERYAWLRARVVAGDKISGENLLTRMRPFVYRRYLDYTVFESLREMKQKIAVEVKRKNMAENVKLGPGGIRELEFFCQIIQMLRGGVDPDVRDLDILNLLAKLADKTYISPETADGLSTAYRFLRNTEHRLQEFKDLQTHVIPSDALGRLRLARSMGFDDDEAFLEMLDRMRTRVHDHFEQLLVIEGPAEKVSSTKASLDSVWQDLLDPEESANLLVKIGYEEPEKALSILKYLRDAPETRALSPKGRHRINRLIPKLLKDVGNAPQPDLVLNRIVDLIKTIERRTNYIALLLENPMVLSHLIQLADKSPWIISFLARHPVLLDELLDPRTLYSPPNKTELKSDLSGRLEHISDDDLEFLIEALCIFKQVNTLRVAAADVTDALHIKKVSDRLTEIAETVLEKVMDLAWQFMVKKHGVPVCLPDHKPCNKGFLIVGYGKVGGIELGYHSDLDLVFLHSGAPVKTRGGEQPIDTPYFFSRLGQRIVHLLTARTRAGMLYETDMRLRPSGSAGPLVSQIDSFFDYQMNESWIWEKQALIRARPLCGDAHLARRFDDIRKTILVCKRDEETLRKEVTAMRQKMRKERWQPNAGKFDLKEGEGGIVDIEFLVQYLVLLKSHDHPELVTWTDNVRILETLLKNRIINDQTAGLLTEAYLTFRTAIHRLNLQEKPAKVSADQFDTLRSGVVDIWKAHIG